MYASPTPSSRPQEPLRIAASMFSSSLSVIRTAETFMMQLFHLLLAEKDLDVRPVCELEKPVLYLPIRLPCSVFLLHPRPPALRQPPQCRPESLIEDHVTGDPPAAQQQQ